jgi:hypothetical protein
MVPGDWYTDVYLTRLDANAEGDKLPKNDSRSSGNE